MILFIYAILSSVIGGARPSQTTQPNVTNETFIEEIHYDRVDYFDEGFDIGELLVKLFTPKEKQDSDKVRVLSNIIKIDLDEEEGQPATNHCINALHQDRQKILIISSLILNVVTLLMTSITLLVASINYRNQSRYKVCTKDSVYYHETAYTPEQTSLTSSSCDK